MRGTDNQLIMRAKENMLTWDELKELLDELNNANDFFHKAFKAEKIIVHDHTPEKDIVNFPYRINIDTGCNFSGKLSCVCLNDLNEEHHFINT